MRTFAFAAAVLTAILFALQSSAPRVSAQGDGRPSGASAAPAPPPAQSAAPLDSFATERDSLMNVVLKHIAGREQQPAESVFKDIRILKGVPAGRVPRIMSMGFGRSLGVSCNHCHVPGEWEKEEKPTKQVTRDMWVMMNAINLEHLAKMKGLRSDKPSVNCTTCHRGAKKPALNL